jgi:hypothetical protein
MDPDRATLGSSCRDKRLHESPLINQLRPKSAATEHYFLRRARNLYLGITRWRIPVENHQAHMDLWRDILADHLAIRRFHPEKILYTKSRIFRLNEAGAAEETWMEIDEYSDRETYDRQMKITQGDPEMAAFEQKLLARFDPILVPGSAITDECWSEQFQFEIEGRAGSP